MLEDSPKRIAPAQGKDAQEAAIRANAAPAASDTLTEKAEAAIRSRQQKHESAVLGTKRSAETAASADGHATSLLVAPNAKRQKTDADWGGAPEQLSVCIFDNSHLCISYNRYLCMCLTTAICVIVLQQFSVYMSYNSANQPEIGAAWT